MMNTEALKIGGITLVCIMLLGCAGTSIFSTPWSENIALATHGTQANHPALNDGKLDTIATVEAKNKERMLTLAFSETKSIRRIVIHNDNLFRFTVEYWDANTESWEIVHTVRQRRDIQNERAQHQYVFDRLDIETDKLRLNITRTVDDDVKPKTYRGTDDIVINRVTRVGGYHPFYRVLTQSPAKVREVEVYHLTN